MNIQRRGDTYFIRISAGTDSAGKRVYVTETYRPDWSTPTGRRRSDSSVEKEVQLYAHDLEQKVKDGRYNPASKMTFREFADVWRTQYAEKKLQASTFSQDWRSLEKDFIPLYGDKMISDIRATDIQSFADGLQARGLKPATVHRRVTSVSSVFTFAVKRRILEYNPCDYVELASIEHRDMTCFTAEQCRIFLDFIAQPWESKYSAHKRKLASTGEEYTVPDYVEHHDASSQYVALFTLLIYSGMRRGEVLALTWNDVDLDHHTISITKAVGRESDGDEFMKGPKTKAGFRTFTLPSEVFRKLSDWKREQMEMSMKLGTAWKGKFGAEYDDNFIFIQADGNRMNTSTPNNYLKKAIARYNAQCTDEADRLPELHLHDLRHCCASILIEAGTPITEVSRRLGHAKVSTTLDIYAHATAPLDKDASDALEKVFSAV